MGIFYLQGSPYSPENVMGGPSTTPAPQCSSPYGMAPSPTPIQPQVRPATGVRPTNDISIEFEIQSKFEILCCKMCLTLKHRETHGCVVSTVATDALVLKHQTISIHNAD